MIKKKNYKKESTQIFLGTDYVRSRHWCITPANYVYSYTQVSILLIALSLHVNCESKLLQRRWYESNIYIHNPSTMYTICNFFLELKFRQYYYYYLDAVHV